MCDSTKTCGRCKKEKDINEFMSPNGTGRGVGKTYKWCNHCRKVNFGGKSVAQQLKAKKTTTSELNAINKIASDTNDNCWTHLG